MLWEMTNKEQKRRKRCKYITSGVFIIDNCIIFKIIFYFVPRALRIKFENTLCRIISRENNGGRVILIDENVIPLCFS